MNKILKYAFSRTEEEVQESVDIFLENPTKDNFKSILRTINRVRIMNGEVNEEDVVNIN
jgi:hypothetical protein